MRYELSDHEWAAVKPMLPNKPRGVRRVNDRRVLNGIPIQKSQVPESQSPLWGVGRMHLRRAHSMDLVRHKSLQPPQIGILDTMLMKFHDGVV
jgi:hypothetical protein